MKPNCEESLSGFAFNCKLRHYTGGFASGKGMRLFLDESYLVDLGLSKSNRGKVVSAAAEAKVGRCRLTPG